MLSLLVAAAALSACMPPEIPKEALVWTEETASRSKLQTRRFETKDERALLSATSDVLKELGFAIDHQAPELGLIAASKKESAYNVGEIATSAAVAIITYALTIPTSIPYSKDQLIRVSVVTRRGTNDDDTLVRLTFQRVVWDTEGKVAKSELIENAAAYQIFFDKLAKAAAVEAHDR